MKVINISTQFTTSPGSRKIVQGPFSGEEFRNRFLNDAFASGDKIKIIFDGALGYPPAFLEEIFGQLTRDNTQFSETEILNRFEFVSNNDPKLIKDVSRYIKEARKNK